MYAEVIVLTYQSPDIQSFAYLVPKNLEREIKVGQLVEVSFGKRNPLGLVIALKNHPRESEDQILNQVQDDKKIIIKPINKIVSQPLLLPYQVELLKWMSEYYIAPMVNCLEAMLPTTALSAKRLSTNAGGWHSWKGSRQRADSQRTISHSSTNVLNRALAGGKQLTGPAYGQTIVLVPTVNRIPETLAKFPNAKNYVLYHNELKPADKFAAWLKILSGDVDYIFGSRSAIFAPCPALSEIIIFDEHNHAYKDERSPYFDTFTAAEKISQLTNAQIKIIDSAPKISTYFLIDSIASLQNDKKSQVLNIEIPKLANPTTIVNMKAERLAQNYSPISEKLLEALKTNVRNNKKSLLFLNKKKESGSLFCKSCKSHIFLEKQPQTCPNCGSSDFYFNFINTTTLAKEVQKQIPSAKIELISNHPTIQPSNHPTIDIATTQIFYTPHLIKYALATDIATDTLLNRADFSSGEMLYEQIASLKTLLKENGTLILQTHDPENLLIKSAAKGDFLTYYHEQLKLRRMLFYPPFALLVKLTIKGKNRQKVEEKSQQLLSKLRNSIQPYHHPTIQLLGPYQPMFFSKQASYNIIVKCKLGSYSLDERRKAIQKISPLLKGLSKDVQVTVEPTSIN